MTTMYFQLRCPQNDKDTGIKTFRQKMQTQYAVKMKEKQVQDVKEIKVVFWGGCANSNSREMTR